MSLPPARLLAFAVIFGAAMFTPQSAPGAEAILKNGWLEARIPGEGDVLLRSLRSTTRDFDNLRTVTKGDTFLPFDEGEDEAEGMRLALTRDGQKEYPRWKVVAAKETAVRLQDEEFGISAVVTVPSGASRLEIAFTFPPGIAVEKAELEMMLQVGGTFLGVPTEEPADSLILPLGRNGETTLSSTPISMNDTGRFVPAAEWWAVADHVARYVFACRADLPGLALEQQPIMINGQEALRESVLLPTPEGKEIRLTFSLLDQMTELAALSAHAGFSLTRNESRNGTLTFAFAVSEKVVNGRLRLVAPDEEKPLLELEAGEWKPGELFSAEIPSPEKRGSLHVELSGDGFHEKTPLFVP